LIITAAHLTAVDAKIDAHTAGRGFAHEAFEAGLT
jgi:hypothetical protein